MTSASTASAIAQLILGGLAVLIATIQVVLVMGASRTGDAKRLRRTIGRAVLIVALYAAAIVALSRRPLWSWGFLVASFAVSLFVPADGRSRAGHRHLRKFTTAAASRRPSSGRPK